MSRIFCPYHDEDNIEATHVATYDEVDEYAAGIVEMNRFQCTEDPTHTWSHPSKNYWLRQSAWGSEWRQKRDKWRNID